MDTIKTVAEMKITSTASELAKKIADAARAIEAKGSKNIKEISSSRGNSYTVNPFLIEVDPTFNCRDFTTPDTIAHVESLALDIAQHGVLHPLTVFLRDGTPILVDGECRLRATLHAITVLGADIEAVPVLVADRGINDASRMASQKRHNSGKPYTPLEDAALVVKLAAFKWDGAKIERETGISQSRQSQLKKINAMPEAARDLVVAGSVSASLAQKIIESEGTVKGVETLKEAVKEAKKQGKDKALPKHIMVNNVPKIDVKKLALGMFTKLIKEADIDEDGEDVVIKVGNAFKLTRAEWEALHDSLV